MSAVLGDFTLANTTFRGNSADAFGGGMYNDRSNPSLTDVNFSDNSADQGGGIYNLTSSPTLVDVTFIHNHAGFSGGGMVNATQSSPMLLNTRFISNTSDWEGGGMWNWNLEYSSNTLGPKLVNAVFIDNTASYRGGGLHNQNADTILINVTFSGNSANSTGGGLLNAYRTLTAHNCILWNNSSATGSQVFHISGTTSLSYSLVQGGCPSGAYCDHVIDADPQFEGAANGDLRLKANSPAIDAGDNSAIPADVLDLDGDGNTTEPVPFDLAGNPRFVDIPGKPNTGSGSEPIVDIGAYERPMPRDTAEPIDAGFPITDLITTTDKAAWYKVDVPKPGSTLAVTLSGLSEDYDLFLFGPAIDEASGHRRGSNHPLPPHPG
jgi:hypothetical protein